MQFAIVKMKTKWSSLTLIEKIDKVSMYDGTYTDLLHFWKKKFWNFLRDMCCTAIDVEVLWKCRTTKPISSKVPYYFFCLFFPLVIMSIASLTETQGLLQQA